MRLRHIEQCSFNRSEWTNFASVVSSRRGIRLGPKDVVLLVSRNGKQLVFVHGFKELEYISAREVSKKTEVLQSVRYRITGSGSWNPLMLKNYARDAGIELQGLKAFEDYYKNLE